jgi:hypothetical protein
VLIRYCLLVFLLSISISFDPIHLLGLAVVAAIAMAKSSAPGKAAQWSFTVTAVIGIS